MADDIPIMLPLKECVKRTGMPYHYIRNLCLNNEVIHVRSGKKFFVNYENLCERLNRGENMRL